MQVINNGQLYYRTQAMTLPQAERFARCIQGNPRFLDVAVCKSNYTPSEERCWYVRYLPTSPTRQAELVADHADARRERAQAQAARYEFVLDDTGRYFHCLNVESGEVHETTERCCSCADFHYRGRQTGVPCKHVVMLREALSTIRGWSDAAHPAAPAPRPESDHARALRERAEMWP